MPVKPWLVIMVNTGAVVPVKRFWTPWTARLAARKLRGEWVGGGHPSFVTYWAPHKDLGDNLEKLFNKEH